MISDKLKQVILQTLELDDFDLTDETLATEVPGWDSLRHVEILLAVERAFGIHFRTLEILRLPNVGALQTLIDKKTTA
jgi:acyl carrier protein